MSRKYRLIRLGAYEKQNKDGRIGMLGKTIEIATPGARLSVKHQQLVIQRPESEAASVPLEDTGLLILDNTQCSLTHSVLTGVLEAGAVIMASDKSHLPLGLMLPLNRYHGVAARQIAQAGAGLPLKKRLWQQLVKNKISGQARVLEYFHQSDSGSGSGPIKLIHSVGQER